MAVWQNKYHGRKDTAVIEVKDLAKQFLMSKGAPHQSAEGAVEGPNAHRDAEDIVRNRWIEVLV